MKIRCEKCGLVTDIVNAAAIIWIVKNNEFTCPKCKNTIKIKEKENKSDENNI